MRQFHEDWVLFEAPEKTKGGNPKAPSMDVYLKWVADARDKISESTIRRSFKSCGIRIDPNAADDNIIHCFKPMDRYLDYNCQKMRALKRKLIHCWSHLIRPNFATFVNKSKLLMKKSIRRHRLNRSHL